jgi:hypothetical protein
MERDGMPTMMGVVTTRPSCASDMGSSFSSFWHNEPRSSLSEDNESDGEARYFFLKRRYRQMALIGEVGSDNEMDGDLVMWILVWSELVAFGVLISGFLVMSFLHPESFSLAKLHLDARLASINTLVLITSGWLAAEA